MKNFIKVLAFIFSALLIISCDPNPDANGDLLNGLGGAGNGSGNGGGTVITGPRIIHKEMEGNTVKTEYISSGGKLMEVIRKQDNGSIQKETIYYNGTKISKITINTTPTTPNTLSPTYEFFYTSNRLSKIVTSQTLLGSTMYNTYTMTYDAEGKVVKILDVFSDSYPAIDGTFRECVLTYTNGNVNKSVINQGFYENGNLTDSDEAASFVFENYDNKKNPYLTLPIEYKIFLSTIGAGSMSFLLSSNNYGKITSYAALVSVPIFTIPMVYTYDSENYPKTVNGNNLIYKPL